MLLVMLLWCFKMNREEMLESVRNFLSQFGEIRKREDEILKAMSSVDRADFMPRELVGCCSCWN